MDMFIGMCMDTCMNTCTCLYGHVHSMRTINVLAVQASAYLVCVDMSSDMGIDMCGDTSVGKSITMRTGLCMDMCANSCL